MALKVGSIISGRPIRNTGYIIVEKYMCFKHGYKTKLPVNLFFRTRFEFEENSERGLFPSMPSKDAFLIVEICSF